VRERNLFVRLTADRTVFSMARGTHSMRRILFACAIVTASFVLMPQRQAGAQQAYGRSWGRTYNTQDWERFYHYPYTYYPQNFWGGEYYRSSEDLYYRYPPEMRIPVYNKGWHNYYPAGRSFQNGRMFHREMGLKYHRGHHFILDVF
jgi:hypothetical protein